MYLLLKIWNILGKNDKNKVIFLSILMIFAMFLETLSIGLILPVIGLIVDPESFLSLFKSFNAEHVYNNIDKNELIFYSLITLVIVFLVKNIFLSFFYWFQFSIAYGAQRNTSKRLFKSYLNEDYNFHIHENSARLIRNTTTETSQFTLSILSSLILITECFVIIGILTFLLIVDTSSTLILGIVFILFGFIFQKTTRKLIGMWGDNRHLFEGMRIQHLQQGLGGIKEVKLYGREDYFLKIYDFNNLGLSKMLRNIKFMNQLPRMLAEFLAVLVVFFLIFTTLLSSKDLVSLIPVLGLLAASATRIIPSVNRIMAAVQNLRFSLPVIEMLHKEINNLKSLKTRKEIKDKKKVSFKDKISFMDVSFKYPSSDKYVLKNVDLEINKGDCVGIIGKSGEGKSTFVDLITGLLKPSSGQITIDNKDIGQNLRPYQNIIGYVPQNIYFLDSSIKENIGFGLDDDEINEEFIYSLIEKVELTEFINDLPLKLNTKIGEKGIMISGGQKQRLGIARAIYHDPSIVIFDEATSALDKLTEQKILESINKLKGDKTMFIISHDYNTLKICDKVFKIENTSIQRKE